MMIGAPPIGKPQRKLPGRGLTKPRLATTPLCLVLELHQSIMLQACESADFLVKCDGLQNLVSYVDYACFQWKNTNDPSCQQ